jgi:Rad3-related DNA helicase
MKRQDHLDFLGHFPRNQYPNPSGNQEKALRVLSRQNSSATLELPTGSGKTAIGYTFLKTLEQSDCKSLFYIVPTKTLVDQVKKLHPDAKVIYGRNEYPCLFYQDAVTAEEVPCSMLDCPHRIDQETGKTEIAGVEPCPYLLAKFQAKKGGIIVCTTAFYLFTHLFSDEWDDCEGLVVDEAHGIASTVRSCLSYEITDYQLYRSIDLLHAIEADEVEILREFMFKMKEVIQRRSSRTATLLEANEISELLGILYKIKPSNLSRKISKAVKSGLIDAGEKREVLKKLEVLSRNLVRYLRSLEYSLPAEGRQPLNYTYAYYEQEIGKNDKVQYRLVIKAYHVAPIIQRILAPRTLAYSATIGDPEVFGFETGIKFPFYSFGSDFPSENTRIYLPSDTPNLAMKSRNRQDLTKSIRKMAKACKTFADAGQRSLVVVVSDAERQKFLMLAQEEGVRAVSYGNGIRPREAAKKFQEGEGDVLVGTVSNYGEGVDLPKNIASVIFYLRPGYPNPNDPGTIFEERRFGNMRWKLWNWRVMIEALQVRGRNVRSVSDLGVTIFVSQQFKRFLFPALPAWLQEAYKGDLTLKQSVENALELLK